MNNDKNGRKEGGGKVKDRRGKKRRTKCLKGFAVVLSKAEFGVARTHKYDTGKQERYSFATWK